MCLGGGGAIIIMCCFMNVEIHYIKEKNLLRSLLNSCV